MTQKDKENSRVSSSQNTVHCSEGAKLECNAPCAAQAQTGKKEENKLRKNQEGEKRAEARETLLPRTQYTALILSQATKDKVTRETEIN